MCSRGYISLFTPMYIYVYTCRYTSTAVYGHVALELPPDASACVRRLSSSPAEAVQAVSLSAASHATRL